MSDEFTVIKFFSHSIKLHPSFFVMLVKLMVLNIVKSSIKLLLKTGLTHTGHSESFPASGVGLAAAAALRRRVEAAALRPLVVAAVGRGHRGTRLASGDTWGVGSDGDGASPPRVVRRKRKRPVPHRSALSAGPPGKSLDRNAPRGSRAVGRAAPCPPARRVPAGAPPRGPVPGVGL